MLVWNTDHFRPHGTSVTNGALFLGSTAADGILYFKNSIDLNGTGETDVTDRRFQVEGSAIAVLEGAIVNNGGTPIGLQKKASGTLVLAADNTYDGDTYILGGTLVVGAGGTTGTLGGGTSVTNFGALVFNRSNNYIVNQLIVGNGAVAQIGSGTLTLTGNNTYSGTTTVTNGTLRINGTHTGGGLITASVNGRLGGSGSVGDVTIGDGGILSPGNSIGTLTVANLDLQEGAKLEWNLSTDSENPAASDLLIVTGSLTGSYIYEFDFLGSGYYDGVNPTVYTLIRYNDTVDIDANSFTAKPNSLATGLSGEFSIASVGDDYELQLTVIPEPASLGTLGILALAAILRRRLRR
jgi:fibronectin-binding autotransporter adhesin